MPLPLLRWLAPKRGLFDDLESVSPAFPSDASPEMKNVRVNKATWATRLGMEPNYSIPGVSRTRLIGDYYPDSGERIRLAARGVDGSVGFYTLLVGTDGAYQLIQDSDGNDIDDLAGKFIHCNVVNGFLYVTDQAGILHRLEFDPDTGARVLNPVEGLPTPADTATAKPTWWRYVETWLDGSGSYEGWDETGNSVFTNQEAGNSEPGIGLDGSTVNRMRVLDNDDTGEFLTKIPSGGSIGDKLGIELATYQLGLWINQTSARTLIAFQWGTDKPNEQQYQIDPQQANVSYPLFLDLNGMEILNFLRAKNIQQVTASNPRNLFVSGIVQCGRLTGQYQWRGTYMRPDTDEESNPCAPFPSTPAVFQAGRSMQQGTADALRRCMFLTLPSNPDKEPGDLKCFYRSGGVPSLTVTVTGQAINTFVGECLDFNTALDGAASADDLTFDVDDPSGLSEGDWVVLDKGEETEEFLQILSIAGDTVTSYTPLVYAHGDGTDVEVGFLDNVPNEVLATEVRKLDLDRDPPPYGIGFVVSLPNGRMAVGPFYEEGDTPGTFDVFRPLGVGFSNQPQPITGRRRDQEVIPLAADPYTGDSPTQGFRVNVAVDAQGDRIMWMGLFKNRLTVLTTRFCYQTADFSQPQWAADSWLKRFDRGCIAPESVTVVNGELVWVSRGPAVLKWDGVSAGPEDISYLRVSRALSEAPMGYEAYGAAMPQDNLTAYVQQWFAVCHFQGQALRYCLYMTPEDPVVWRFTDLTVDAISPEVLVSSPSYEFTTADIGRLLQTPNPASTGWLPNEWFQIIGIDGTSAILDRAPAAPNADIEFVDEIGFEGQTSTGGTNPFSITLTRNVPVGHWVFVFSQIADTGAGTGSFGTPTDDKGNTYSLVKLVNNGLLHGGIWATQVETALEIGDQITQQFNNYRNLIFRAAEFSGIVDGASPSQTISDTGVDSTSTTEPFAAISTVPQLLLCMLNAHTENSGASLGDSTGAAGTDWTKMVAPTGVSSNQGGTGWNDDLFVEWRVIEAPATPNADWTYTPFPTNLTTQRWILEAAAFPATAPGVAVLWNPWNSTPLDWDAINDAWEPREYLGDFNEDGEGELPRGWETASVRYGSTDDNELMAAEMNAQEGLTYQQEKGDDDAGTPIHVLAKTARQAMPGEIIARIRDLWLRLRRTAGESDRLNVGVTMGGGEYQESTNTYEIMLEGEGDTELAVYEDNQKAPYGRWGQITLEGHVSDRPAPREVTGEAQEVRDGRASE